jgi:hypothetical protein
VREPNTRNFCIIAGLPRSGTAWLSAALNLHPEIFAFHEAAQSSEGYMNRVSEKLQYFKHVVDCTTVTLPSFDTVPATRIWIERDPVACLTSLGKIFGASEVGKLWESILDLGEGWRDRHQPAVFQFDDFMGGRRVQTVRAIAAEIGVDNPREISQAKIEHLSHLNVQIHRLCADYYKGQVAQTTP